MDLSLRPLSPLLAELIVSMQKQEPAILQGFHTLVKTILLIDFNSLSQSGMKKIESIICRVNAAYTNLMLLHRQIKSPTKTPDTIRFHAFDKEYAWLSNFFPTLIFDAANKCIYPSVEHGYVSFKARNTEKYDPKTLTYINHECTAKEAKAFGQELWQRVSEEDTNTALIEMTRLIQLKFMQNTSLQKLLMVTNICSLEEFTSDNFWGTGHGKCVSKDSNRLGKIIMHYRNTLILSASQDNQPAKPVPVKSTKSKKTPLINT